jgi:hypothetical protein
MRINKANEEPVDQSALSSYVFVTLLQQMAQLRGSFRKFQSASKVKEAKPART